MGSFPASRRGSALPHTRTKTKTEHTRRSALVLVRARGHEIPASRGARCAERIHTGCSQASCRDSALPLTCTKNKEGAASRLLLCFWCGQEDMKSPLRGAQDAPTMQKIEPLLHLAEVLRYPKPVSTQKRSGKPLLFRIGAGKRT